MGVSTEVLHSVSPMQTFNPVPVNSQVLEGLLDVHTTPYSSSFLSRLHGFQPTAQDGVLAVDWDNVTPWMDLMSDIREHYSLMQCASCSCFGSSD